MMKKLIKITAFTALLATSMGAHADWSATAGYASYQQDYQGSDISLGGIYAGFGYTFGDNKFTWMPEIRIGTGVADDTYSGINVEIDDFMSVALRAQYNFSPSFGIYVEPTLEELGLTASAGGISASSDGWNAGIGVGATYRVSAGLSLEAGYKKVDEFDILSFGLRYYF